MHSLSWSIYMIGFSSVMSNTFGFVIAICVILAVVLSVMTACIVFEGTNGDPFAEHGISIKRWLVAAWIAVFIAIGIQMVIPSRDTAIMMASADIISDLKQVDEKTAKDEALRNIAGPSLKLLQDLIKSNQDQPAPPAPPAPVCSYDNVKQTGDVPPSR